MEPASACREGVVAVVLRGDRFLLVRRAPHIAAGGAWCFPGGAIEPGESQQSALVREFREEVGAAIQPIARIWEYVRSDGLRLHWWLAELADSRLAPNPAEVAELRWCTLQEIEALPGILEGNLAFLKAVGPKLLAQPSAPLPRPG